MLQTMTGRMMTLLGMTATMVMIATPSKKKIAY
jgi:hypothetical protein